MNEEQVVWSLISSEIERFRTRVYDQVKWFYAQYDPRKSLDRSFIVDLISLVNNELDLITCEVEDGKKNNC